MLRRARRLLRRAGDAPVLLDADMEAALNGVQLLRETGRAVCPVRMLHSCICAPQLWPTLLHIAVSWCACGTQGLAAIRVVCSVCLQADLPCILTLRCRGAGRSAGACQHLQ